MPKYKRKPVVVEAVKIKSPISIDNSGTTLKGYPGDYLITERNGEQYPCKPELFENQYEPVKDHFHIMKTKLYQTLRIIKRKSKHLTHYK